MQRTLFKGSVLFVWATVETWQYNVEDFAEEDPPPLQLYDAHF